MTLLIPGSVFVAFLLGIGMALMAMFLRFVTREGGEMWIVFCIAVAVYVATFGVYISVALVVRP